MSTALEACRDFYARFSHPSTLGRCQFGEAIADAGRQMSAPDPWLDGAALAETLEDSFWELAGEAPEEGFTWTKETHIEVRQAIALMMQALVVLNRVQEREGPRYREWDERKSKERQEDRSNVVPFQPRSRSEIHPKVQP